MSDSYLPEFMNDQFLLPQMMQNYSFTNDDVKLDDMHQRISEIDAAKRKFVPSVTDIASWSGFIKINTVEEVEEVMSELKTKGNIIAKKMNLILHGLQDRIFQREDEGVFYYWSGHTHLPFENTNAIFTLFKKS